MLPSRSCIFPFSSSLPLVSSFVRLSFPIASYSQAALRLQSPSQPSRRPFPRYSALSSSSDDDYLSDRDRGDRSSRSDDRPGDYNSRIEDGENIELRTTAEEHKRRSLKPSALVAELDKHIVGQKDAKKAVAIALRNRWQRHLLPKELKDEVMPKNILLVGPTGSGKTEIARRLAKITDSPFIKVEATKFTEIGFYGKDVDSIIKDLVRQTVAQLKAKKRSEYREKVSQQVEDAILDALIGPHESDRARKQWRLQLQQGLLDQMHVEMEVPPVPDDKDPLAAALSKLFKTVPQRLTISQIRPLLTDSLLNKAMRDLDVSKQAIQLVEQDGIVFLDEIDKICSASGDRAHRSSADASSEGVQRDLLPLVEGTAISTNLGTVHTDHILFICSGAFHQVKPSDLLPELQGRLPVRVELKPLTVDDFYRILTVPVNNLLRQQVELLKVDNIHLEFTEGAVKEIAATAAEVNKTVENIGARRLNTVIQRVCEDLSYDAADMAPGSKVVVDEKFVQERVQPLLKGPDIRKYVL